MNSAIHVMLIDDNEDDIFILKEVLGEHSQIEIVSIAKNGKEAIDYLHNLPAKASKNMPDLILLDINMPGKSGLEVLEEIKTNQRTKALPVVMLTTSNREDDINRAYSNGASSFIRKPSDLGEFQRVTAFFSNYWVHVSLLPSL